MRRGVKRFRDECIANPPDNRTMFAPWAIKAGIALADRDIAKISPVAR
jgi:hypothetical protein